MGQKEGQSTGLIDRITDSEKTNAPTSHVDRHTGDRKEGGTKGFVTSGGKKGAGARRG